MLSMSELKERLEESVQKHGYIKYTDTAEFAEYRLKRECGQVSLSISITKNLRLLHVTESTGKESHIAIYQHCVTGGVKESAKAQVSEISAESLDAALLWFIERLEFHSSMTKS
jgi:hypothetical protein